MTVYLIRHGSTLGNLEGRYVGTTDEPLCGVGVEELRRRAYPDCDRLFSSPMRRCIETAHTIYPGRAVELVDGFRECDFGDFEYRNYAELSGRADYQAWVDSYGTLPFPNGESREEYSERSYRAFLGVLSRVDCGRVSMVVHGGTIMSVMERLNPGSDYFDYRVGNGECVTLEL